MRMEYSYIIIPLGVTSNHLEQDGTTPLTKAPSAELSGMAENRAVVPGVLRRHRGLAKATAHIC